MRIGKTFLFGLLGSIIIACGTFWGIFGSFNLDFLFENPQYEYSVADLSQENSFNSYEFSGNTITSLEDDSWFQVTLPRKGIIQKVEIVLSSLNVSEPAQIYYTQQSEFDSGTYKEIILHEGNNIIEFGGERNVRSLRFDLTQKSGETTTVEKIVISEEYTKRVHYWVFTPLLLLLYWLTCTIYINSCCLKNKIYSNEKWRKKYNTIDQIISLSLSDFKARFSGSYLGIFWGIIQPLSTILLFWFVFQVGFRSQPINDVPFILWLAAGMIPWNYFYDSWFGGTAAFTQYSYIVKKVVFRIEVLPLVKVLSASCLNIIFNSILIVIYCLYGRFPGFHIFDMIYFSLCLGTLTLGLSYITATLNVFMKDVGQFLGIALQFLMWMTPMMWSYTTIPDSMSWFYKLNPLHYIINGYRESLINGHWFYYQYKEMIWFWFVTIVLLLLGRKMVKKLSPHFADVL